MLYEPLVEEFDTILFVSKTGDDSASGSVAEQLKTLAAAIAKVSGKTLIVLGEGEFSGGEINDSTYNLTVFGKNEKTSIAIDNITVNKLSLQGLVVYFNNTTIHTSDLQLLRVAAMESANIETARATLQNVSAKDELSFNISETFSAKDLYGTFSGVAAENSTIDITWERGWQSNFVKNQGCLFKSLSKDLMPDAEQGQWDIGAGFAKTEQLNATVRVAQVILDSIFAIITVKPDTAESSFNGFITVSSNSRDLILAQLKINPHNSATAKFLGTQPPLRTVYGTLIQDAFVDENAPTVNTGDSTKLLYSPTTETFLRWRFTPNYDDFYKSENEQNSFLVLEISKTSQVGGEIEVRLSADTWQEFGVTYENKPQTEFYTKVAVEPNFVGQLIIPMGSLLKSQDKTKPFTVSLSAVATDLYETYSRDGEIELAPKLYYQYYYYPPRLTKRTMNGKITVRVDANGVDENGKVKNPNLILRGNVFVDSFNIVSNIKAEVKIPHWEKESRIEGLITIAQSARSSIAGKITVPFFEKENKIAALITVMAKSENSIVGSVNIPTFGGQSEIKGKLTIQSHEKSTMSGVVTVEQVITQSEIKGFVKVVSIAQTSIGGQVFVQFDEASSHFIGQIFIPNTKWNTIQGLLNVPQFKPDAYPKMSANVNVLALDFSLFKATIYVIPNIPRQYAFTTN